MHSDARCCECRRMHSLVVPRSLCLAAVGARHCGGAPIRHYTLRMPRDDAGLVGIAIPL